MAASFRQLKQYQEVSFFSLPFLFFTLPFRMERNTSQRKKLCSLILMFWGWMYCDWWKAYKCWMTERIETMIRMNCTFVFAFTYVSMYTNTMSKELFGVSQRGDGSTNNFFLSIFSWYCERISWFKFNVMRFSVVFFCPSCYTHFLPKIESIASKKLCSRQFYSYFSCRCCEIYTVAI